MLTELTIHDFAIIDDLRLQFDAGFNVLTGETGAGKSIILDAVMLVLGGRADTSMVRAGCETAVLEATFHLDKSLQALINPLLETEGLDDEEGGNTLTLSREVRVNGRNYARVNGRSVNLNLLRDIAAPLIDIHGQGEHLSLLQPRSHLPLLDAYAGLQKAQRGLAGEVSKLQHLQRELKDLQQDERTLAHRIDMLQFQVQEIDAAHLQPGEEEELRIERERLANAEHLTRATTEAVSLLSGGLEDDTQSIVDMLGQTERVLTQLARFDESQHGRLESLQGLAFQINELAADLQNYLEELEFNPDRLNQVEERLELINLLKRKYGADIPTILAQREKAAAELEQITHSEERIAALQKEQDDMLRQLGKLAYALSQKRKEAAQKLAQMVVTQLADLKMDGARFEVAFSHELHPEGVYVGTERLAFDQTGIDRAEFLISTNPGEPLKPMVKVASGGETARLMLALKTALAQVDATPTLIFDEIDQGIGGRVGHIVGRKLWGLTAVAHHQVIVVTHLPQLAGFGDCHFRVSKGVVNERTITKVETLDRNGRIAELAAMLGTQAQHARDGAATILDQATAAKNG
ncbi:MAG: DNA repair protein RecN [Ardenticatenaceae bacterium]|nr:DNA repair protein RecN [Anaerolineales bacterium]MCB8920985.1 DNA repair protein RecN [Ardenticatenaceae bacterium]MCB8991591.1 DNA repair protein RecN [Ardenticatenaceae bacterium]MCB9004220.1 DNA repair protein RecN [Ardenticatenaceae bacterium]